MARITYVKSARQRYATVPVLDESGQPKKIPVMRKDGTQKVTKHGKEVFRVLTTEDKSQPKPNRTCDKCGTEIKVGDPYKWIAPKSGPYGGHKKFRCGACPPWQVWEYSSSLSARIQQITHTADEALEAASTLDDLQTERDNAADMFDEIAEEQEEKSNNIVEGFGHETSMSEELQDQADQLHQHADEIRGTEPDTETADCSACEGGGTVDCEDCGGDGTTVDDQPCENCERGFAKCGACEGSGEASEDDDAYGQLVDDYRSTLSDIISSSPV
jgi:hypothetical protein